MNIKAFIALSAVMFVAQIGLGIVAPFLPLYAKSMNASGLWIGIMFAGYGLSRLILMPITGRLSDLGGRKKFITVGLFAFAGTSLLYTMASNIYQLTIIRFLHGATTSLIVPISEAYIADLIPKGKEGTYINFFSMWRFLGAGAGPVLGGVVAEVFNLNAAFYAMSGIGILALFLLIFFVPPIEPSVKRTSGSQTSSYRVILRDNGVKGLCLYQTSRSFWRHGSSAFLPILAASTFMMGKASIGLLLAVYQMVDGIVQGFSGPLADRYNKVTLLVIFSIASAALFSLVPHTTTTLALFAILALVAAFDGVARGPAMALNVEFGRQYQGMGTIMGLSHFANDIGTVIGPVAFGIVIDLFNLNLAFYLGAGVGIVTTLITAYLFSRRYQAV